MFDYSTYDYFISSFLVERCGLVVAKQVDRWQVKLAMGSNLDVDSLVHGCVLYLGVLSTMADLRVLSLGSYGLVLGMDWLESHQARIDFWGKRVQCLDDSEKNLEVVGIQQPISLHMISVMQMKHCVHKGCHLFVVRVDELDEGEI